MDTLRAQLVAHNILCWLQWIGWYLMIFSWTKHLSALRYVRFTVEHSVNLCSIWLFSNFHCKRYKMSHLPLSLLLFVWTWASVARHTWSTNWTQGWTGQDSIEFCIPVIFCEQQFHWFYFILVFFFLSWAKVCQRQ